MESIWSARESIEPILGIVEFPFRWLIEKVNFDPGLVGFLLYDGLVLLIVGLLLKKLVGKTIEFFQRDRMASKSDIDALIAERTKMDPSMHNAHSLKGAVEPLKKNKQWDKLGELYASVGMHAEATKAYKKAGDLKSAADSVAKAGKPMEA